MTKKDYVLVAGILKECREEDWSNDDVLNLVCVGFVKHFSRDRTAFNAERFLKACGCIQ